MLKNAEYEIAEEQKMVGIYLSGTGNTKHCIEKLMHLLDESAVTVPIEAVNVVDEIRRNKTIVLGYPTQFSNVPFMVRDFICSNAWLWNGKKVLCVATMGAFSGDGAGCVARLLRKYGAAILGGLHICMPDSVCDVKLLKKSADENRKIIINADKKIEKTAAEIRNGKYPHDGITFFSHLLGLLGQRLWFFTKTNGYSNKLKIGSNCTGCGLCSKLCPMKNIEVKEKIAVPGNKCTMCYRCISNCPQKAITLLGKEVWEQCRFDKYPV